MILLQRIASENNKSEKKKKNGIRQQTDKNLSAQYRRSRTIILL